MISWTRDGSEPCHAPVRSQRSHVHHSDSLIAQETGKGKAINILKGKENLTSYKFNTMIAEHFFCKICGIYTHHNRRSDPNGAAVNIGCIDAIDPFEYKADFIDMKNK